MDVLDDVFTGEPSTSQLPAAYLHTSNKSSSAAAALDSQGTGNEGVGSHAAPSTGPSYYGSDFSSSPRANLNANRGPAKRGRIIAFADDSESRTSPSSMACSARSMEPSYYTSSASEREHYGSKDDSKHQSTLHSSAAAAASERGYRAGPRSNKHSLEQPSRDDPGAASASQSAPSPSSSYYACAADRVYQPTPGHRPDDRKRKSTELAPMSDWRSQLTQLRETDEAVLGEVLCALLAEDQVESMRLTIGILGAAASVDLYAAAMAAEVGAHGGLQ